MISYQINQLSCVSCHVISKVSILELIERGRKNMRDADKARGKREMREGESI